MIKPHFRRERALEGPCGPVYVWACRSLDRVGFGMDWRTAWDAWRARIPSLPKPVVVMFPPHQDRTLQ